MKGCKFKETGFVFCFVIIFFLVVNTNSALSAEHCVIDEAGLNAALATAVSNGQDDVIKIQQGTYNGNFIYASNQAFGVTLEGGYTSGCASRVVDATNTVLDAGGSGPVLVFSAPDLIADFAVDGLTLQNGNVNAQGGGLYAVTNGTVTLTNNTITNNAGTSGGGVYSSSSGTVTLTNNIINNNNANGSGGGVYSSSSGTVTLTNNTINNNDATGSGGGVYSSSSGTVTLTNNTIEYNSSINGPGGGIYSSGTMTLINNTINNNNSNQPGGGVYSSGTVTLTNNTIEYNSLKIGEGAGVYSSGTVTLTNNTIEYNSSNNGHGGGVYSSGIGTLANNTINNNNVNGPGGGVYSSGTVTLTNNTINNNNANQSGGGVYSSGTVTLTNNTINNNNANGSGGGVRLLLYYDDAISNIYNNIIWNNGAGNKGGDLYIENDANTNYFPSTVNLFNNDFDQSAEGIYIQLPFDIDSSNLNNADPFFLDYANDNYHLETGSPCRDAGNNAAPELPDLDKDGNPRVMNGIVDIGAYEYPGAAIPIIDSFIAFPTSGEAPLPVTFTCVAHDFGGSIQSYTLDFGDGSSQSNTNGLFNYEYVTTGTFDATCTTTDNDGESATSDTVTIAVTSHVNLPPVAYCGQEKAVVFNEITFDGTGSADPDGSVVSYEWTLQHEDGTIKTASGPNPTISNLIRGFYDVTLKVYDNEGAFGTDTMLLAAAGSCSCTPSSIHVESITLTTIKGSKGRKFGQVTVFVADDSGNPVSSVEVTGTFSGDFNETVSGVTGADGSVSFTTSLEVKKPTYTFCVSSLANALPYESGDNVETCDELN